MCPRVANPLAFLVLLLLAPLVPDADAAPLTDDNYLAGYAAAVLERELKITTPSLRVRDGVITIAESDLAGVDAAKVREVLSSLPGARGVEVVKAVPPIPPPAATDAPLGRDPKPADYNTGWLPGGMLFRPLLADPRWPHFSAAYQYYLKDHNLDSVGAVSFGETFTLYRNRFGPVLWELGMQAGVFAVFDLSTDSYDLMNADYFVSGVLAARFKDFSVLGRFYHQSSHLGDEFILHNPEVERIGLSYEAIDLKLSYEFWPGLRVYGGGSYLVDRYPSDLDPWVVQGGLEFRSPWPSGARVRPIAALDLQSREENKWSLDLSARAGLEFPGVILGRNLQILLEYYKGHSPNGQFYKDKIEYIGVGLHFHF
jgi:hypothetical protein